ncbi:asparagine--tRNA ligase [Buchnera aphidicola]|uniref:asparagine--tRNA ligase n=1 Tax=Buchnera aphidicola TaxID=9 RepID=UPI00209202D9|nr:asparagine--tRNA ligase [Buchnera aphidicola]USS94362.1 asparagine--tRNA ligase [Buchnera aphidicola (Sipha maydis)]
MLHVFIKDIFEDKIIIGKNIQIKGWVKNKRSSQSNLFFIDIYDGSCLNTLQLVIKNNLINRNDVLKLTSGCSIHVEGKLVSSLNLKQKFEIHVLKLNVIGWLKNSDTYPMSAKKHTMEHLRKFAHLRPRTNIIGAIARIRSTVFQSIHNFFYKNNFYWVSSPIITSLNAEGAGDMFSVLNKNIDSNNFFGKNVFLTVSGQLTIEAYACSLSKVYTFGPIFRAENSNTTRHLSEFWMLEVELAFSNLENIIELIEKILKYLFKIILKKNYNDLFFLQNVLKLKVIKRLKNFIKSTIKKVEYLEAIEILKKNKSLFSQPIFYGIELSTDHEKFLVNEYFKEPVIIKNYPKEIKPFYMRINDDKKTVSAIDILFPDIGEIIGGSEREERVEYLDQRIKELNLSKDDYKWYRELRLYGTVPHSGFGLGLERLIMYITGIQNIKDVIPFPRTVRNADF